MDGQEKKMASPRREKKIVGEVARKLGNGGDGSRVDEHDAMVLGDGRVDDGDQLDVAELLVAAVALVGDRVGGYDSRVLTYVGGTFHVWTHGLAFGHYWGRAWA